eukprot:gnl/MRDRNA2_/MRDRNA2_64438_c0_seq1.p1 gnl/MRDRNA2_/MRDRNA2_64438_c0~~gnl/MRDRNA2_/MRDRNA2_64438_c0_seq1.p1  ORF type:complete len:476 (+),score=39.63 gnl/MRDRNA2_/MRDRNA2_64438_c0_seq1:38-1429(+)
MAVTLVILCVALGWHKTDSKRTFLRGLSPSDYKSLVDGIAALVRAQMVLWYFGTSFWKWNRAFFDSKSNCATFFFLQLLAAYLPASLTSDGLVKLVAWVAPYLTVAVEGLIPILQIWPGWSTRCGIMLGLLLHFLIAVTPPPNNVPTYGLSLAVRYFFFLPDAATRVVLDVKLVLKGATKISFFDIVGLSGTVLTVIAATNFSSGRQTYNYMPANSGFYQRDWVMGGYAALVLLYARAIYVDATRVPSSPDRSQGWCWGKLWWLVVVQSFLFVYGFMILGLADNGPPKPFSNIRVMGGSNHFLVPTGLLQKFVGHLPEFADGPLSSEVIRIESTTSSYINAMYPSELTELVDPRAHEFLKIAGHSGRIFGALGGRLTLPGKVMRNEPGDGFITYTMPVLEFRRLLAEVRQQNESFLLEYTRLPQYDANQAEGATGTLVRLWENGAGAMNCAVLGKNVPCDERQ